MNKKIVYSDRTKRIIKEFNYIDIYKINPCKPPIDKILDCSICLSNMKKKIITTCTGLKICITGDRVVKFNYESCGCCGTIIHCKLCYPFFELMPLTSCDVSI